MDTVSHILPNKDALEETYQARSVQLRVRMIDSHIPVDILCQIISPFSIDSTDVLVSLAGVFLLAKPKNTLRSDCSVFEVDNLLETKDKQLRRIFDVDGIANKITADFQGIGGTDVPGDNGCFNLMKGTIFDISFVHS